MYEIRLGGRILLSNILQEDLIWHRITSDYIEYRPPPLLDNFYLYIVTTYVDWIPLYCLQ